MIYITIQTAGADAEEVETRLLAGATIGLEQRESETVAYYSRRRDAEDAAGALADLNPRLVEEPDQNWQAQWQRKWRALAVGARFFLAPEWDSTPAPEGRIRLEMHSGMAFGSGDHATTQLGLLALEQHLRPGDRVLDLGAGSAILLIAAKRLGAALAVGTEVDELAIRLARDRLLQAGLDADLVLTSECGFRDESFDLAVANISPHAAIALSAEMIRMLRPGGRGFIDGFTDEEEEEVVAHYSDMPCVIEGVERREEWRLLSIRRP